METKICKECGRELPIEMFHKNGWGVTNLCKDCHAVKMVDGKKKKKELKELAQNAEKNKTLRLQDFTPRELIAELKRRGYTGKLEYVRTETIDLSNF